MPREYKLYLKDIVNAAVFIEENTAELGYEAFIGDEIRLNAVLYNLGISGEVVKHVPDTIRERAPDIPWQQIAGTRDIIIHGCFEVKLPIIWHAIRYEVPDLRQRIEVLLAELEEE